jgi:hypothetical protein
MNRLFDKYFLSGAIPFTLIPLFLMIFQRKNRVTSPTLLTSITLEKLLKEEKEEDFQRSHH